MYSGCLYYLGFDLQSYQKQYGNIEEVCVFIANAQRERKDIWDLQLLTFRQEYFLSRPDTIWNSSGCGSLCWCHCIHVRRPPQRPQCCKQSYTRQSTLKSSLIWLDSLPLLKDWSWVTYPLHDLMALSSKRVSMARSEQLWSNSLTEADRGPFSRSSLTMQVML